MGIERASVQDITEVLIGSRADPFVVAWGDGECNTNLEELLWRILRGKMVNTMYLHAPFAYRSDDSHGKVFADWQLCTIRGIS